MSAALKIVEPGIAATVQDCGRTGYQRFGVPVSGALDPISLRIANILVGNAPCSGAIEILGAGLGCEVESESAMLAVAGTLGPLTLVSEKVSVLIPAFQSFRACRGDIVRVPAPRGGAVCYLAVEGGFAIEPALGSVSTYRRAGLGGFEGRALLRNDRLALRAGQTNNPPFRLDADIHAPAVLRAMRGPNEDYFTPAAFEALYGAEYKIAPSSDRMGLRLQGPVLKRAIDGELPSEGTSAGGMQVPSDGQPIMLLADRQTTGGYPRIATIIGADIAAAGRLAAGMSVRFAEVSRDEAVWLLKAQRDWLLSLPSQRKPAANDALSVERLLSNNLIGGVTAGTSPDA